MTKLFSRSVDVVVGPKRLTGIDCAFEIEKTIKPEPNTCELKIWNLSEDTRAAFEEISPRKKFQTKGIPVRIEAGYVDDRAILWLGDLRNVYSEYDGVDWITTMNAGDGALAYQNSRVNISYGPMTPAETVLRELVRRLGVGEGNLAQAIALFRVTGIWKVYPNGVVLSGSAARELTDFCRSAGLEWSIQDGTIQILDRGQALRGKAIRVSSDTGMVGSPSVDNLGVLSVRTLLIPDVRVGSMLVVDSTRIKGTYRVVKARWTCDTSSTDWFIDMEARRI